MASPALVASLKAITPFTICRSMSTAKFNQSSRMPLMRIANQIYVRAGAVEGAGHNQVAEKRRTWKKIVRTIYGIGPLNLETKIFHFGVGVDTISLRP
jgi:hypothetical protein